MSDRVIFASAWADRFDATDKLVSMSSIGLAQIADYWANALTRNDPSAMVLTITDH